MLIKKPENYKFYQYRMMDDTVVEYKRIVVHHFEIGGGSGVMRQHRHIERLVEWAKSDRGQWILKNAAEDPYYDSYQWVESWTVEFKIVATFELKKLSEYYLRFN